MNEINTARFTVVIPAFNASESIVEAIRSGKEAGADRIIVVDDGSTDETARVATAAGAECITQVNVGASIARMTGGDKVESEYVTFLDADDRLLPDGVRSSLKILDSDPGIAVAAGTVAAIGKDGKRRDFPVRYSPVNINSLLTRGFGPWPPAAEVIRVAAYRQSLQVEPPPLHPRFADDYELLIRLSIVGKIDVRAQPACVYSMSGGKSAKNARAAIEAKELVRKHYARHLGIDIQTMNSKEVEAASYARLARAKMFDGQYFQAGKFILEWLRSNPKGLLTRIRRRLNNG